MKILYLYRNPAMGYSIGKVFAPIERAISEYEKVVSSGKKIIFIRGSNPFQTMYLNF